jgi:lipopolysaccharide transport system ATP-binding protein
MLGAPDEVTDAYLATSHEGRSVQYHDGEGQRWGSGEIRIDCVELIDRSGQTVSVARTGEPLSFRVVLSASQPVEHPEVVLSVHDQTGVLVSEVSTRTRGLVIDRVDATTELTLGVEALPLAEGTYELSCTVRDESGQRELDTRVKFLRFDVQRGTLTDGGLVTLGGSWTVTP